MHNDLEPYVVEHRGAVSGFIADYLNEAASRAGVTVVWQNIQWERQLPILKRNSKNICSVALGKTADRQAFIHYSAAIGTDAWFILIGKKNNSRLKDHQTFKAVTSDTTLSPILQVDTVYSDYINLLLAGKIMPRVESSLLRMTRAIRFGSHDYMVTTPLVAKSLFAKNDISAELEIYQHYQDLSGDHRYYLGCSLSTDPALFDPLNNEIKQAGLAMPS